MINLTDNTRRRLGYGFIAAAMVMAVAEIMLSFRTGELLSAAEITLLAITFGFVLYHSVRAAPRNGAVWAIVWAALFGLSGQLGETIGFIDTGFTVPEIEASEVLVAPSQIGPWSALGFSIALSAWLPASFLLANHVLILFPHGSAPSPTWRKIAWFSGLSMAVLTVATMLGTAPWVSRSYSELYQSDFGPAGIVSLLMLGLMAVALAAIINLIRRFRRSTGEERLQYRWVTFGLGLQVFSIFTFGLWPDPWGTVVSIVGLAAIPVGFGIAITKYRLFNIDVVISRTLVFVVLVGFITAVYAVVAAGVGSLAGGSSLGWSIAATAVVAVVFEPVRDRVQRWVNRLVYGRLATPYEVLSDLTGRLAATEREEGLLGRMAQRLAEGTGADRATVWTADDSGFVPAAFEPVSDGPPASVATVADIAGSVVPIVHDGETLGALSVESRRGDALSPTEQRLVEDLAGSAALLMRRLQLDQALAQKAVELEKSRRRLVNAQDVERRRLERELDEGAQQQVVALQIQLRLAEQQARTEGAEAAAELIAQTAAETRDAIAQIRALSNGIYPPLLEAEGLAAAVTALAEVAPIDVQVRADVTGRYPLPVEGAVYFCVSEALTNAVKHGNGPILVSLRDRGGSLMFAVTDSGPGFNPVTADRGSGLNNMTDRLDALGGAITIESKARGTTVTGSVPAKPAVPV